MAWSVELRVETTWSCVVPCQVYPGWVKSVEDHGYIIDFGVSGKMGFLLKKNAAEFVKMCNGGKPLVCGQVTMCKVLSDVDARSVPVTVDPSVVGGALVGGDSLVQLPALQPGMLVNTAVKEVMSTCAMTMTSLWACLSTGGLQWSDCHVPRWVRGFSWSPPPPLLEHLPRLPPTQEEVQRSSIVGRRGGEKDWSDPSADTGGGEELHLHRHGVWGHI